MAIQIGAKPDSGFDDPLGMLEDCHRRIERFLDIFCRVADRAQGRALTVEERAAVEAALHYFREAGPRHSADEEQSLFPRLRALHDPGVEQVDRLEGEHHEAAAVHEAVDRHFTAWCAGGRLDEEGSALLLSHTASLKRLYAGHIRTEETVVFPQAARILDRAALAAMGAEFRARRS